MYIANNDIPGPIYRSFFYSLILFSSITLQTTKAITENLTSKPLLLDKRGGFWNSFFKIQGGSRSHTKLTDSNESHKSTPRMKGLKSESPVTETDDDEFVVGGGEINEKKRLFKNGNEKGLLPENKIHASEKDKNQQLSHVLHALVGLNRYPNYLSRWSVEDIDTLEKSLETNLANVRKQKQNIMDRRSGITKMVHELLSDEKNNHEFDLDTLDVPETWDDVKNKVLHPRASEAIFQSKMFQESKHQKVVIPTVQSVISGETKVELCPAALEEWLDQEMFDVYSFPLLSEKFCTNVKKIVKKIVSLGETTEYAHLNIGKRVLDLDRIGLFWLNDLIFHLIIRPVARHLFWDTESIGDLDWRQGYVAGYSSRPSAEKGVQRERLVPHTDDSEVTFNLCLGDKTFEGGLLQFRGLRGTSEEGQLVGEFQPILGTALLHAGRHLHEVTQVTAGNRYAYIIWTRSWKGVRSETCPCCWLNRRQGTRCICGKAWN